MSIITAAAAAASQASGADEVRRIRLDSIAIRDFRNLERVDLELPPEGAVIVGDNGHGKSNFLEAIYYLQIMRSIRDVRDQDLTRFDTLGFHISAHAHTPEGRDISVGFDRNAKRKKVLIDGTEVRRLSDALGALPSVMFSPRDLELVSGAPTERRRYLDLVLALTDKKYLRALQHYRANLARRNAALRNAARRGSASADQEVAVWEPALAEHGSFLIETRARWVREWSADFSNSLQRIGESGSSQMRYVSPFAESESRRDVLLAALEEKRALDLRRGTTHVGPHRDDLELTLDGKDLRLFGSAGQQRSAAIALRLLEAATLRNFAGAEPLLLLDDPFAELDIRRAARILLMLEERGLGQTILVVPREADIPPGLMKLDRLRITGGSIAAWLPRGVAKALTATELEGS
ncbi:MAG TPA: DNA replication and repair protein RecF [Gemmatimonadaceae bacterium]|nr:DNA replication and repair protein RecF [Gemmatimonadaceae bacterium]